MQASVKYGVEVKKIGFADMKACTEQSRVTSKRAESAQARRRFAHRRRRRVLHVLDDHHPSLFPGSCVLCPRHSFSQ